MEPDLQVERDKRRERIATAVLAHAAGVYVDGAGGDAEDVIARFLPQARGQVRLAFMYADLLMAESDRRHEDEQLPAAVFAPFASTPTECGE